MSKEYPAPLGNGFWIIGMMRFKEKVSLMVETNEVWQYDPKSEGFFRKEFPFRVEIEADENEYFPVYSYTENGVAIFMWEKSAGLGVFVEIDKTLIGKMLTKIKGIPFSKN